MEALLSSMMFEAFGFMWFSTLQKIISATFEAGLPWRIRLASSDLLPSSLHHPDVIELTPVFLSPVIGFYSRGWILVSLSLLSVDVRSG